MAGTTLDERQWITLNLAIAAGASSRAELVGRVVSGAKFDPRVVERAIDALRSAALLGELSDGGDQLVVTDTGRALVEQVRATTGQVVARAYADIPAEDLVTAARVLIAITANLSEELAKM